MILPPRQPRLLARLPRVGKKVQNFTRMAALILDNQSISLLFWGANGVYDVIFCESRLLFACDVKKPTEVNVIYGNARLLAALINSLTKFLEGVLSCRALILGILNNNSSKSYRGY